VIATTQVPFVRGGAELLAENLHAALLEAGHEAEIVSIPFKWYPPDRILDHMLASRLMKIEESCGTRNDRMIGLKFPAYMMPHPNKVMWLLHQYRAAYDTWDSPVGDIINWPDGNAIRNAIRSADEAIIPQCRAIYTLSQGVSDRLRRFNGIESVPLHHPPPGAASLRRGAYGDYVLVPSRIDESKRQHLVLEALALTRQPVRAVFIGAGNAPGYERSLHERTQSAGLQDRVQWLGAVTEQQKIGLYADCLAVAYPPIDEDYGYVTLEAMLSGKAVLTCSDSGGPLDFVEDRETGLIREADPQDLADALDLLWSDRPLAARLGTAGFENYQAQDFNWSSVVARLLA